LQLACQRSIRSQRKGKVCLCIVISVHTVTNFLLITLPLRGLQSIAISFSHCIYVCLTVCMSDHSLISKVTHPSFMKFLVHVSCGLFPPLMTVTLCTSSFVDVCVYWRQVPVTCQLSPLMAANAAIQCIAIMHCSHPLYMQQMSVFATT